jgi:release factor glutamine methyltransferase
MTLHEWRDHITSILSQALFENASQEAKWLLEAITHKNCTLNFDYTLTSSEELKLNEWLERRLKSEPLSRIKGIREFWSLPFYINEHTLDPRPETELIVEAVIARSDVSTERILDLGTGSGCILISLLYELKNATGVGVDINQGALDIAKINASQNGVSERTTFVESNWGENLKEQFDIIVSNPPYIPTTDIEELEKTVKDYDPHLALDGGADGLDCYRLIAKNMKHLLKEDGFFLFEIGQGQRRQVEEILKHEGFGNLFSLKDYNGIERVIGGFSQ